MNKDLIPRLDHQSPTPLYHQIAVHLQDLITQGVLRAGDQLPSERVLADQTGVSRMTVRQAVRTLVIDGWCERQRGRGIFVRNRPVIVDARSFEGFTSNMVRQGLHASTVALSSRVCTPPDWVSERLDLAGGATTVELLRLRCIEGHPAVLETEWFPADRFPGLENHDFSQSLYAILDKEYATQVATTVDILEAHLPSGEEQELLEVDLVPVILRNRVGYIDDGTAVEVVRSVYNPTQYEFRMTLVPAERTGDRAAIDR